ncbi:MAG: hypothetical protein KIT84_06725 [Labilithrix sp.]|nr:hypothetical protein [Labilithrix sp.]MCW5810687.1 hypothetical protein [Labilithrix sp.]
MRARVIAGLALALVALSVATACVDGVTPDCSTASVCAPIEGEPPSLPDANAPEASTQEDAGGVDADADGG